MGKTVKSTYGDNLVQFIIIFIIGIISAIKGIGWNYTVTGGMWYNPITFAPVYIWIWGGQSLDLTVANAYIVAFCAFCVLIWWIILSFIVMKAVDGMLKGWKWELEKKN
jgi:hypothetical protein